MFIFLHVKMSFVEIVQSILWKIYLFPKNSPTSLHRKSQKTSRSFHQRPLQGLNYSHLCANIFVIFSDCLAHRNKISFLKPEETRPKKIQKAYLVLALKIGRKKAQTSKQKYFTYVSYKSKQILTFQ